MTFEALRNGLLMPSVGRGVARAIAKHCGTFVSEESHIVRDGGLGGVVVGLARCELLEVGVATGVVPGCRGVLVAIRGCSPHVAGRVETV
jgi:hypothetical protein